MPRAVASRGRQPSSVAAEVGSRTGLPAGNRRNSSSSPASADAAIITCCACCDPIQATSSRLAVNAPATAPMVLAAYTPPTSRPGSWPGSATDASASGKLAPQSAGGRQHDPQRPQEIEPEVQPDIYARWRD